MRIVGTRLIGTLEPVALSHKEFGPETGQGSRLAPVASGSRSDHQRTVKREGDIPVGPSWAVRSRSG